MVRVSPTSGTIESLARTLIVLAPESSATVAASLLATGGSLTGGDGDVDGGGGGAAVAVADGVGERVGTEEVGVRGVGDGGAADNRDRAVRALRDPGDGEGLADVGQDRVVGQHVDRIGARILGHRRRIAVRDRQVVHRCDRDVDRVLIDEAAGVGRTHGQRIGAVIVEVAPIHEAGQRGVDIALRAGDRDVRGRAADHRRRTCAGHRQRPVQHGQHDLAEITFDVAHEDRVDRKRRILVHALRAGRC